MKSSSRGAGGFGAGNAYSGSAARKTGGGIGMLSSKKAADDDFDIVDDILDNLTAEKDMEPIGSRRPQTAANNFNNRKESLWSAGGPAARNQPNNMGTGSAYGAPLDDDLDGLGDDDDDDNALGIGLS